MLTVPSNTDIHTLYFRERIMAGSVDEHEPPLRRDKCSAAMEGRQRSCFSHLSAMIGEEDKSRQSRDHRALQASPHPCAPNLVWRQKVSQWCYDVVDHLGESRDVVYLAMNVLDRYCVFRTTLEARDYEIAVMTALFLAVRVSGNATLELPQLMNLSRHGVRMREILDIGKSMTDSLSWERRLVTPLQFVRAMVELLDVSRELKSSLSESASYLVEVSVCDAFFSGMHPFKVAYAAVANAIGSGPQSRLSDATSREFFRQLSKLHDAQEEISLLQSRLYHIYSHCMENRQSALHVILDEEDEACVVVPPRGGIRVVSAQGLYQPSPTSFEEVANVAKASSSKHVRHEDRAVSLIPSKKLRTL